MGYSCTRDAANAIGVIGRMFATNGNPNVLTIKGSQYFFERGKEQSDGSISGTLYLMLPNDMARKAGSVKIDADGMVRRFPRLTMCERAEAMSTLRDMSARNPGMLHAWAIGRV